MRLLGRKAYPQGYAGVLFDSRTHGKTAELSPTLTSDGLYEGEDFVRIAAERDAFTEHLAVEMTKTWIDIFENR